MTPTSKMPPLPHLRSGQWLGIDIGSARGKVCSFCLIASDGRGGVAVSFEKGAADAEYPAVNEKSSLLDLERPPTYLQATIEAAVRRVLDRSELVSACWQQASVPGPTAVAIDAPAGFAQPGQRLRLTEQASTQTFSTPDRSTFEALMSQQSDAYLRVNVFWKCVALAVYQHLAELLKLAQSADSAAAVVAALTYSDAYGYSETHNHAVTRRLRETFPSDVFKRSNGRDGTLCDAARQVLGTTLTASANWQAAGTGQQRPGTPTMQRLEAIRHAVDRELRAGNDALSSMHKRPAGYGDLWDAFACAFTACCEDHGGAELRGWSDDPQEQRRLRQEGVILTVGCR